MCYIVLYKSVHVCPGQFKTTFIQVLLNICMQFKEGSNLICHPAMVIFFNRDSDWFVGLGTFACGLPSTRKHGSQSLMCLLAVVPVGGVQSNHILFQTNTCLDCSILLRTEKLLQIIMTI